MIYLDKFFHGFADRVNYFDSWQEIPCGCDVVGIVFYQFDRTTIIDRIQSVRPRTRMLLVVLNEPVGNILEILEYFQPDKGIIFFGDAVLSESRANFHTDISWFVSPRNYYSTEPWAKRLLESLEHDQDRPFRFDCLLGTARPHRDIVQSLYENSLVKDQIIFSYFKQNHTLADGIWDQPYAITCTTESVQVDRLNDADYHAPLSAMIPKYIYDRSHYSIVCETTAYNEFSQFTEKVAKPMLAQRVFVAFCGRFYLRHLRSQGFRTFSDVVDETYDSEADVMTRYQLAWQQVEYLCQQDPNIIRQQIQPVLSHNKRHFLETDWHENFKKFLAC